MALFMRVTTERLLECWDDENAFVSAVGHEIAAGHLTPKLGEKLIVGYYMAPDRTRRRVRLGRW